MPGFSIALTHCYFNVCNARDIQGGNILLFRISLAHDRSDQRVNLPDSQLRIREDVNNLRADDLRREGLQAQLDVRLGRIETRLGLHDA